MDRQHLQDPARGAPAEAKLGWIRPEVDRLVAGGAEASTGADIEGLDGLS